MWSPTGARIGLSAVSLTQAIMPDKDKAGSAPVGLGQFPIWDLAPLAAVEIDDRAGRCPASGPADRRVDRAANGRAKPAPDLRHEQQGAREIRDKPRQQK